jgi:hypothetical protein
MKPEYNSRRLFGITRSKGKMYELGLPEASHIAIPLHDKPEALFVLTLGTLGDAAAELNNLAETNAPTPVLAAEELQFSASFFDAFLASRFQSEIARDVTLFGGRLLSGTATRQQSCAG